LNASVKQSKLVLLEMPTTSDIVARLMTAAANGQIFQFALTDTSALLPTLLQCVRDSTSTAASPPAPQPSAGDVADLHEEALELATNFILAARIPGAKVAGRGETPANYVSFGADWKSSNTLGSVKIVTGRPGMKGIDVTAEEIAANAQACQGKFASGRSSELVDSDVVFRGFSSCSDKSGDRTTEYFVTPRKKGGFVLFSVLAGPADPGSTSDVKSDRINDFQKAALTATR
jgi:hypothetical protein